MIAKIESGSRRIDALELIRIASALPVPVDYLLRPAPPILSRRASLVAEDTGTDVTRESERLEVALVAWLHDVRQLLIGLNVLQPKHLLRTETPVDSSAAARELALWVRGELEAGT